MCGNEFTKEFEKYSDIFINNNDKSDIECIKIIF
jgi:hypothetical protein